MKNLISADVIRILRKPTYRILLAVNLVIAIIAAIYTKTEMWNGLAFVTNQATVIQFGVELIMGVAIYISVYADEFSSNSMQCLIGRGISRWRLLLAKFIDCVIVTAISFAVYAIFVALMGLIMGAGMTGEEAAFLFSRIFVGAVKTIGFATIAMIFLYWTKNVAIATLVDLLLIVGGDNIANFIFPKLPMIKFLHIENTVFANAVDCANVSFMLGNGTGLGTILWQLIKVCVISLILSFLFFRKKELDF